MTAFNQIAAAAQETTETVRTTTTTTAAPGCDEVIQPPTLPSRYGAILLLLLLSVVFRLCSIHKDGDVRCHFCRDMTHVNVIIIITVTPPPKSRATQCLLSSPSLPFCNYSYYALESNDLKNGFEFKRKWVERFLSLLVYVSDVKDILICIMYLRYNYLITIYKLFRYLLFQ